MNGWDTSIYGFHPRSSEAEAAYAQRMRDGKIRRKGDDGKLVNTCSPWKNGQEPSNVRKDRETRASRNAVGTKSSRQRPKPCD